MAELRTGDVVAGWLIEQELGAGGMGRVYLARHPRLPRHDVLKVITGDLANDPTFRTRFLREADVVCGLQHPHVVVVHDRGEFDGQLYIAMQYVPGGDLRRLLSQGERLPPLRAIGIAGQIASALDAAHARGLVHRDVKPENVLLASTTDGGDHAVLADFGISRLAAGNTSRLTGTGMVLATPGYAAPEVVNGQPVDGRADQYALACLLFEMLTGSLPFPRDNGMAALVAHVTSPPPDASARVPELPKALDPVLRQGLAKDPTQRFANCSQLVAGVRAAVEDARTAEATSNGSGGSSREKRPRWRGAALIATAALLVPLLIGGTVAVVQQRGRGDARSPSASPSIRPQGSVGTEPALVQARRGEVVRAGSDFATSFFTYDYRDLDNYISQVESRSTGSLRDDFIGKKEKLRSTLSDAQGTASAKVLAGAPRDVTQNSAVVLLAVDQTVHKKSGPPDGVTQHYRLLLTMQRVEDSWQTSGLNPVDGSQPSVCGDSSASDAQQVALKAACVSAGRLFSFDYRTLETDLAAQLAVATGPFRAEVANTTQAAVRPLAVKSQVVVDAKAVDAALDSWDAERAVFLVYLNQAVTSNLLPQPRLDRVRMRLEMEQVDGRWLASGVKAL